VELHSWPHESLRAHSIFRMAFSVFSALRASWAGIRSCGSLVALSLNIESPGSPVSAPDTFRGTLVRGEIATTAGRASHFNRLRLFTGALQYYELDGVIVTLREQREGEVWGCPLPLTGDTIALLAERANLPCRHHC
jgi:hypothetical protein